MKRSQKGQAHTNTRKLNQDISTGTTIFLNRKRVNVCSQCACPFCDLFNSWWEFSLPFPLICDFRTSVRSISTICNDCFPIKPFINMFVVSVESRLGMILHFDLMEKVMLCCTVQVQDPTTNMSSAYLLISEHWMKTPCSSLLSTQIRQ